MVEKPIVLLFADPNPLSISLAETLLKNFCRIKIISKDQNGWRISTKHFEDNRSLEFLDDARGRQEEANYVVFISGCFNKKPERKILTDVIKIADKEKIKSLLVFPYEKRPCLENSLATSARTIFVGDLFGPGMFLDERSFVSRSLKDFTLKKELRVAKNIVDYYPTFIPDVAKTLVKTLFSFGGVEEELAIFSKKISSADFANLLKKINPQISLTYQKESPLDIHNVDKHVELPTPLEEAIEKTVVWALSKKQKSALPARFTESRRAGRPRKRRVGINRRLIWATLAVLAIFVFPIFLLALSASSLFLGAKLAQSGNLELSAKSMSVSKGLSRIVQKTGFPPTKQGASVLGDASDIGLRLVLLADYSRELLLNILKDKPFDTRAYSENLSLELDDLYQDSGFLQSEIKEGKGFLARSIGKAVDVKSLGKFREKILLAKKIAEEIPEILAQDGEKTYLVLFQNNMQLRPTGGFIGSLALVTFRQGNLFNIRVLDVYSVDSRLKGKVEPPEAIKNYLGEDNWFLRDSNWDSDFPTSAAQAEWFLEKELDEPVDGVIGLDLEFVRQALKEIGPLYLADFGQEINFQNLYEVTQYWGKKDFSAALLKTFLTELAEVSPEKYFPLFRGFYQNLEEKHAQIFLHNQKAQRAIADLGWEGSVSQPACGGNCFADFFGMVEANIGRNEANYFITRSATLTTTFENGLVKKKLSVFLKNKANPALGTPAKYKTYFRVMVPQEADFGEVMVTSAGKYKRLAPEIKQLKGRKEAGVLVEIGPGQSKSITFLWEMKFSASFSQPGEYLFFWRKQAGTDRDPIVMEFGFPQGIRVQASPNFSLTQGAYVGYNSLLSRDFVSRIYW